MGPYGPAIIGGGSGIPPMPMNYPVPPSQFSLPPGYQVMPQLPSLSQGYGRQ